MNIGVLAVQGAFIEHEAMLASMGVPCFEIRQKKDLERPFDGLILPGGESTVMGALLRDLHLFDALRNRILAGLPVLGTCAGLILLSDTRHFGTLPATVRRNAYGRQLGSFTAEGQLEDGSPYPMIFIRAPQIEKVQDGTAILARLDGQTVGIRYGRQIGVAFHPELTGNPTVHRAFLNLIAGAAEKRGKGNEGK